MNQLELEGDLMRYLDPKLATPLVRNYYSDSGRLYSGRAFNSLGGGGDRSEIVNVITAEDIVAVSLLSVNIPGEAAIEILVPQREILSSYLENIPTDVALWDADDETVDDHDSQAAKAWDVLDGIRDIAWVTAGKLLARKRPQLLPVYDNVVKEALQPHSTDFWIPLRNSLRANEFEAVRAMEVIRDGAGCGDEVPLLRILDVAVWMTSQH